MPTYFVGFTITLSAIMVSCEYFSKQWPFTTREVLVHYIPGLRDLMWSRSIDGIVWTLEIEMKFYLLCAALSVFFRQQSLKVFFVPLFLFISSLCINEIIPILQTKCRLAWQLSMTYMTLAQYVIYMFIGVVFHYLYRARIDSNRAYLCIGGLYTLFCVQWWAGPYSANLTVAWSYAFALLTFCFAYSFPYLFRSNPAFDFLADISYPLYVIHGVPGYVLLRIMLEAGVKAWFSLLTVTSLFIFLSWLIHNYIENPTRKYGRIFANLIEKSSVCKNINRCILQVFGGSKKTF